MSILLETPRLRVRELTLDDVENVCEIFGDAETVQYLSHTKDRAQVQAWIHWAHDNYQRHGWGMWAIELKESGVFVGECGLIAHKNIDGHDEMELAYHRVRQWWHDGCATEATGAVRDWAFAHGFLRHVSSIDIRNIASIRVAENNGMTLEQTLKSTQNPWKKDVAVYVRAIALYRIQQTVSIKVTISYIRKVH